MVQPRWTLDHSTIESVSNAAWRAPFIRLKPQPLVIDVVSCYSDAASAAGTAHGAAAGSRDSNQVEGGARPETGAARHSHQDHWPLYGEA